MPAIAALEDLKTAQKDLQEAKDLNELKAVFKKWRRISWKNMCGAPMGKGRAIQRLDGGDIPASSEWFYLPGQTVVTGAHAGRIERGRELVNSAYTLDSGSIALYYLQQMM